MGEIARFPLIDGPLTATPSASAGLILKMAADLRRRGVPADEREAIRALCDCGYRMGDVAILAEDALFEARQSAVTAEVEKR
jgi:hypothetical protein